MRISYPWKIGILLVGLWLWPGIGMAQPSIDVRVDRNTVVMGGTLKLSITIRGGSALTTPEIPELGNFDVVGRSSGNSIEIMNGEMSVTKTWEFVLSPRKAGTFDIGPISTHIEGQTYSSGPLSVQVLPADQGQPYQTFPQPRAQPMPPSFPQGGGGRGRTLPSYPFASPAPQQSRPLTFITAETDKQEAYVGEQILFTFRMYTAVNVQAAQLNLPDFKDFISEELITERKYEVNLEGRRYAINEWRLALFPTQAGRLKTGKSTVTAGVPVSTGQNRFNYQVFRSSPFRQQYVSKTFTAPSITIQVKKLPPAPKAYSGLVGKFSLKSQLSQDQLATGDTVNYKVTLKGRGNIQEATLPPFPETEFFKVYPSKPEVEIKKSLQGISGEKLFDYALVAARPGATQIPALTVYYFDPESSKYIKLDTKAMAMSIRGGGPGEKLVTAGINERKGILAASKVPTGMKPIQPIGSLLFTQRLSGPESLIYWFLILGVPLAWIGVQIWQRGRAHAIATADDRKQSRAFRKAKAGLGRLDLSDGAKALPILTDIIREYLSSRFLVRGGALTPGEVEKLLYEKKAPAEINRRMVYLLEQLDSWKYGGELGKLPSGKNLSQEIIELLKEIEKGL